MTSFWIESPISLFQTPQIWIDESMHPNAKLNAISRLVILITLIGFLITSTLKIVLTGLITLGAIVVLWLAKKDLKEGFEFDPIHSEDFTKPTTSNPLMNVMLSEINAVGERPRAAPSYDPDVETSINEMTKSMISNNDDTLKAKLFHNLGDEMEFKHSMRAWHPTANTQVPNDQEAFLKFCYGE